MVDREGTMDEDEGDEEEEEEEDVVEEEEMEMEMVDIAIGKRTDNKRAPEMGKFGRRSKRVLEGMMRRLLSK